MRSPDEVFVEGEALSKRLSRHVHALLAAFQGDALRVVPAQADLSDVDLRGQILDSADFSGVCLREACLVEASLRFADFNDADLRGADLSRAELGGVQMTRADLRDADLRAVTFESGRGSFTDARLDGANLDGIADAGNHLGFQSQLKGVEAMADAYGKAYLGLLTALAFGAVTIFTTTDDKLVPNSLMSELPVLRTQVPIAAFFHIGPLIVLGIFAYTEMLHREFRRALHALPAILGDGTRPDAAYSPWVLRERARSAGRWRRSRDESERRLKPGRDSGISISVYHARSTSRGWAKRES